MSQFSIPQQNTRIDNISLKKQQKRSSKLLTIIKLPVIRKAKECKRIKKDTNETNCSLSFF